MIAPQPVIFEPIYQARPWGGRRLADRLGKVLPADAPIGESWELSGLPGAESRVREGELAGRRLGELVAAWGRGLLGGAELIAGRFPLLIKFLDARETLSVQVHPRPEAAAPGEHKNEAWYIVDAAEGSEVWIGLRPGVTPEQLARAAGSAAIVELLQRWPARPGRCYYLPSGVPHALGAGVVLAEVQTPADVTYRLYDWDRVGLDGRARPLHVAEGLAHARGDVPADMILQPRSHAGGVWSTVTRLVRCESFMIDKVRLAAGAAQGLPYCEMAVWIVLSGRGALLRNDRRWTFSRGDVVLIPAVSADILVQTDEPAEWLEVRLPVASSLAGLPRPEPDAPPPTGRGPTPLTRGGGPVDGRGEGDERS